MPYEAAMPTAGSDPSGAVMEYATPAATPRNRVWASAAILFGGLCLVGLGGCFLIGVMILTLPAVATGSPATTVLSGPQLTLMFVLYALSAASIIGACVLLTVGTSALIRITRGV
jgi:FtsH-binding integral membrane protein